MKTNYEKLLIFYLPFTVGERTEMEQHTVSKWFNRYKKEGIKGLETRPGRGRKPIMDCSDEEAVRRAIEQDRQSVNKAREARQQASGKEASESTFPRTRLISTSQRRCDAY